MTGEGRARVRCVIAAARQMAGGAELLLDIAPAPDGSAPTDADAALLGVLLALADLTVDHQAQAEGEGGPP